MDQKVESVLSRFATNNSVFIERIYNHMKAPGGSIIEIVGDSGSGKSYIFQKLFEYLNDKERSPQYYLPPVFHYNHLRNLITRMTTASEEQFDSILHEAQNFNFTAKYDFFFFLTEQLRRRELLKPVDLIIYEGTFLDQYSRDFIEYFVQYFSDVNIKILFFTQQKTFPLADSIHIPTPSTQDIREIIVEIFPDQNKKFITESEIIYNISKGNYFVIQHILNNFFSNATTLDFGSYLDKKVNVTSIVTQNLHELDDNVKKLLFTLFLLDTNGSDSVLKQLFPDADLKNALTTLISKKLIFHFNKRYYIRKVSIIKQQFESLPASKKKLLITPILKTLNESLFGDFCVMFGLCTDELRNDVITYLQHISDYNSLTLIFNDRIDQEKDETALAQLHYQQGMVLMHLNENESASEHFRSALKYCINNNLPAEEIIYQLARCLYLLNSSAFAVEIIKKYSPDSISPFWSAQIKLLKAEILMEEDEYQETLENIEESIRLSADISNREQQLEIRAICRKTRGLLFYYNNEWNKAEAEFTEAGKLFSNIQSNSGMAAINNNLAGLAMLQGEWKRSEELFLKSLEYEQKRYNLDGISGSYSNLGYLFEDENDYKKSLYYLNEALKIQRLLGNRDIITKIYNNIGITYMDNGEYAKAEEAFNQLHEIAVKFNSYRNVIAAYNNLGALFFKSGDWTQATDYYERAIKKSKDNNFYEGMCKSYNNIGELYERRGEYSMAYDYYSKGMELLPNISDDFLKAELYGNLGSVLTHLHKFGEAYGYLVESYDFFKSLSAKDKIIEGSQKQAFYFIQTRNFESANYYLDSALKIAEEINQQYQIGRCYYYKAFLAQNDSEVAQNYLKQAIEKFIQTNNNFELARANFKYAQILFNDEKWEQALQLLTENKKIIKRFGAIKFLEKNDILIQKINKKYAIELKESKQQESLLNQFYEITQSLNEINDFDLLLDAALDKLVEFSEADGGVFCLYPNQQVKDAWEYVIFNNFDTEDKRYNVIMEMVGKTFDSTGCKNIKQPHMAPEYNNIVIFPLTVRNEKRGVICVFTKHGSHYFNEKIYNLLSALCNQIVVIVENLSYENLQKSHAVIREELASQGNFTNIIGKSEKIQEIFHMIDKIKNTPTTVLLEGPSGTGKELIARAIHYNSNRRNKKFIAQYCGALPETLLESELFGHVKGSFTGATHDKKGLFEIADGGTFFLDEIADISLSTQAKLLRFLQEGEVKRVGSTKTEKVDVRVICATNVSLKEKVERGEFRLDLFYRLNVIRIGVPSLKERKSDIPLLAVHFLDKFCRKMSKKVNGISDEAMKYLSSYDWPGNIRQLENEIERAVTLADNDSYIKSSDLSEEIFRFQENTDTINLLEDTSLKAAVEHLERQMILRALNDTSWNQTKAAKRLGLSRQGLIKKIQRYQMEK
jgi:transcriptional regulator with PAS, ATPase and Fis domain/Tfp pilus assembly protein PilF